MMMQSQRRFNSPYLYGGVTLLLGLLLTAVLTWLLVQNNQQHIQSSVGKVAGDTLDQVMTRFRFYQYGLRGMRGSIVTAGSALKRETVAAYSNTRDQRQEFPGARGFGFVRRVPVEQEAAFVAQARMDGWPQFNIYQLAPHAGERFVIQYVEPIERNSAAIGLDIASEKNRREAAIAAMRSGSATLSAPITLVQTTGKHEQSFLMLLPIYRGSAAPTTIAEREAKAIGWSFAPLLMEDVLADLKLNPAYFHLQLSDVTGGASTTFYDSNVNVNPQANLYPQSKEVQVFGRRWHVQLSVHPEYIQSLNLTSPYELLLGGLIASIILSSLVTVLAINRRRAKQLQSEQQRLAAIVSSSADGIIGKTCDGVVTDWNPAAEQLFGYTAAEVLGRRLIDFMVPPELHSEEISILQRVSAGLRVPHFQTQRLCRDGRLIDVSVTVSPILDAKGRVIGASKTVRDISQQKLNEARIQDLNSNLEALVEQRTRELSHLNVLFSNVLQAATEVSIVATDHSGTITLFNRGAERLLGYQADELIGRWTPAIFHLPEEIAVRGAELSAEYGELIEGFHVFTHKPTLEGAETHEWTYVHKNGRPIAVSLAATAMRDELGQVIGYLGIAIDISERKAAEQKLATSLSTTQAILDTVVNPVFTIDSQSLVRSFNPAAERVFGLRAERVIGQPFSQLVLDMLGQYPASLLSRYLNGEVPSLNEQAWEVMAQRSDGSAFPAQLSLGGMMSNGDRVVVGVITDLSLMQQQRAEVSAARDQLQLAADVAQLGVWSWVLADNRLMWNDMMYELYDQPVSLREQGLSYQHWYERVHPDDVEQTAACLQAAVEGRGAYAPIFRIVRLSGEVRWVQAGAQIERDEQGNAVRVTGINRDITTQLELEARLRLAKEEADAASAAKSTFLANMSHEIRTPMNAVLGMLQLVGQTELNQRQHDYVFKAQGAATALLGLLNDILDYSKIEAGKLQIDPHPFELEALLRNLAVVLPGNQAKEDVEIMFDIEPSLPQQLLGDSLRLLQVLINLTGNAIKFTQHGLVQVAVKAIQRRDSAICLHFAVRDTGIGISPEQQSRIFDGFTQAEASTARRFGGTGLGLVISQRLVSLMGGKLQLESQAGQGSCFSFELWLPIIDSAPLVTLPKLPSAPLNVLVVEDNPMVAELILRIIAALGWLTQHAVNGMEAIAAVQAARQQGRQFELVLMDWKMPGLDGLSAARLILQDNVYAPPPMVIMLTAYDKEMLIAALHDEDMPFVDSLTKPVTPQQLLLSVQKALAGNTPLAKLVQKEKLQRLLGLRLLVVEDNELNRQIASELLAGEGANVVVADGGLSGVEHVLSASGAFDAVLMDVQMPDIDGLEATRRIRADVRFAALPIIAMTANASQSDRESCLAAGMNDHVGKPVDLPQLIHVLRQYTGQTAQDADDKPIDDIEQSVQDDLVESLASIMQRFGGNRRLYRTVLFNFSPEATKQLQILGVAIKAQDAAAAQHALHALNGSSGTLGARALSTCAARWEQMLKHAPDQSWLAELDQSVLDQLQQLMVESDALLKLRLGESETVSAPQTMVHNLHQQLAQLLPLLESRNLLALELVEALDAAGALGERITLLQAQVQALDFSAAIQTLKDLIASNGV